MSGLDERQGAALGVAVHTYMTWLDTIATVARPTQDDGLVAQLETEFAAALVRYRERSRARQGVRGWPMMLEPFGPDDKFHAALRRRAPQVRAEIVRDAETGLRHVLVAYRESGPWAAEWDGARYRWGTGPNAGMKLAEDPEDAACAAADTVGAVLAENPRPRTWPISPGSGLTV